jgi:putative heme transporter
MTKAKAGSSRTKKIITVVTLFAMGILVFTIRDQIVQTFTDIQRVNLWAIGIIPLLLIVKFHALTQMHREVLAFFGERIRYRSMYRVQLELNMVNSVFPSGGVTGISYFGLRMKDADVSVGKSTLIQVIKFILLFLSFQLLLVVGLMLLAIEGQANSFLILIAGSLATLLLVGTIALGYILGSKQLINKFFKALTRFINRIIHIFRRKNPETISVDSVEQIFTELHDSYGDIRSNKSVLKRPLLYALLANVAEVMTLYAVYMAFNSFVNPGAVIIAFAVANFAGMISILPGGVGIYEALMTATLIAAGVPAALSLPVTVMYRILTSVFQLIPGYYYYNKNLHANQQHHKEGH